jgi:hypothetical protein
MPRNGSGSIANIVSQFVDQLSVAIEEEALNRARDAVLSAVGGGSSRRGPGGPRRGPGRPPGRPRKKPPIQYCPVPGCKNRAAPVFGMVCGDHKGLPKTQIKKYRAQRRSEREKAKAKN